VVWLVFGSLGGRVRDRRPGWAAYIGFVVRRLGAAGGQGGQGLCAGCAFCRLSVWPCGWARRSQVVSHEADSAFQVEPQEVASAGI